MLACPFCRKSDMVVLELHKTEIDYCISCGGIWLDSGEMEMLYSEVNKKPFDMKLFKQHKTKEKKYRCPVCRKKMDKNSIKTDVDDIIILDVCPNNHGIWFDKGELLKVLEYSYDDLPNEIITFLRDMFLHHKGENR